MPCYGLGAAKCEKDNLTQHAAVDPKLDVPDRVPRGGEPKVAFARGGEERFFDLSLSREVSVRLRGSPNASSRTAGELLGGEFGSVESGGDVRKRHAEDLRTAQTRAFRRDSACQAPRAGPARSSRRAVPRVRGQVSSSRLAAGSGTWTESSSRRARRERTSCERFPPDDRRQPGLHVFNVRRILVANPQPCFLEGIVGFGRRSEHPVGDGAQVGSVLLEAFSQPLALIHRSARLSPASRTFRGRMIELHRVSAS